MPGLNSTLDTFSFDTRSGEWYFVVPGGGGAGCSRIDMEKLRSLADSCQGFNQDRDLFMSLLRSRRPTILDVLRTPKKPGQSVFRHWRREWVDQWQKPVPRQPRRLDYRNEGESWIEAMNVSLTKNPHLSASEAYRFAVRTLGEPPGQGRAESKQARILRLYRQRFGSHKRP